MRQRKIRNLDEKLEALSPFIIEEPETLSGKWAQSMGKDKVCLEIGCGKGQFINKLAALNPDTAYVAVEGNLSVAYHAVNKAGKAAQAAAANAEAGAPTAQAAAGTAAGEAGSEALQAGNLRFILNYVNSLDDLFQPEELEGLYLNFSDPWPKAKHEKRRLTTLKRFTDYARVIRPGGFLEFKTDNDGLFEFTLEQVDEQNLFDVDFVTRDLHAAVPEETIVTTEYEDKFSGKGKNINFIRLIRK